MSKTFQSFASALESLEAEVGTEELSQLLANLLLATSARLVGDVPNNWTVVTPFVSGEVSAFTNIALTKSI